MTGPLVVVVRHAPAPQGSHKHVGNGRIVDASKTTRPWRAAVQAATMQALTAEPDWAEPDDVPMAVTVTFTMARPKRHFTQAKVPVLRADAPDWPAVRPDVDKLARSTLDGLVDGGALADDSRVVSLLVIKAYPGMDADALDEPGAVVTVAPLEVAW